MNVMSRCCPLLLVLCAIAAAGQSSPSSSIRRSFQISGTTVHALSGKPLPKVELALAIAEKPDIIQSVLSDEQGHFVFTGLPAGKYSLAARKRGFPLQGYQEHEQYWTGIAVGPNVSSEGIEFRLSPGGSISGAVTDNENEAVTGGQVLLFRRGIIEGRYITALVQQTTTDDQGHYTLRHLLPGSYLVAVAATPWYTLRQAQDGIGGRVEHSLEMDPPVLDVAYPVTFYPGVTEADHAQPVLLGPGDRMSVDVLLQLVPSLHVLVRSTGPEGHVSNTSFFYNVFGAYPASVNTRQQKLSEDVTEYSGLAPGQVKVSSQSFGGAEGMNSSWTQVVEISRNTEIDPPPGNFGKVSGVLMVSGQPAAPYVPVMLTNIATGEQLRAQVKARGEFMFPGTIEPGSYIVKAFPAPNTAVSHVSAMGAEAVGSELIVSKPGDIRLEICVSKGLARIEGLALKDGKPAPQNMVLLVPDDLEHNVANLRRDQSDSDGTFVLPSVPPGKYTVVAIHDGWDLAWRDPAVVRPYLEHGQAIQVVGNQKYKIQVQVQ